MAKAIVSNGFGKFHLSVLAHELAALGRDVALVTGAYVPPRVSAILSRAPVQKLRRLAHRSETPEAPVDVYSLWLPEILNQLALESRDRALLTTYADGLGLASFRWYAQWQARIIERHGEAGGVFHYRAGFGGRAVELAKRLKLTTVCDHSIAHPLDVVAEEFGGTGQLSDIWHYILQDIEAADHVVVNSDFVRETFARRGWSGERISVHYWGIDDRFLELADAARTSRREPPGDGPVRLLFAGAFERRKGADVLMAALGEVERDVRLRIVGPVPPQMRAQLAQRAAVDDRVEVAGLVDRPTLAREMADADVFVFPSRLEGSARVVFEALAVGLPVVTTPNSGSVVVDGQHGKLVEAGDASALGLAIDELAAMSPRDLAALGDANAAWVREHHRQSRYAAEVARLHDSLAHG